MLTPEDKEEKRILRSRLSKMGITSSPNASLETLRAKFQEASSGNKETATADSTSVKSTAKLAEDIRKEATKLIRVKIKNLNPAKKDLHGEIFTIANSVIGKVSKYVPYDSAGEAYHVPNCIYKLLSRKKFLQVRTFKKEVKGTDQIQIEQSWVPEFSIEVLPQLTTKELNDLAIKQRAQTYFEE